MKKTGIKKLQLGSIADEAAACRKAFKGSKVGDYVQHCHHETLFEVLTEPAEERIAYILSSKSKREQALRLRLFRPVPKTLQKTVKMLYADYKAKRDTLYADYKAKRAPLNADYEAKRDTLHTRICVAGCPWDGKTIFPED